MLLLSVIMRLKSVYCILVDSSNSFAIGFMAHGNTYVNLHKITDVYSIRLYRKQRKKPLRIFKFSEAFLFEFTSNLLLIYYNYPL